MKKWDVDHLPVFDNYCNSHLTSILTSTFPQITDIIPKVSPKRPQIPKAITNLEQMTQYNFLALVFPLVECKF